MGLEVKNFQGEVFPPLDSGAMYLHKLLLSLAV